LALGSKKAFSPKEENLGTKTQARRAVVPSSGVVTSERNRTDQWQRQARRVGLGVPARLPAGEEFDARVQYAAACQIATPRKPAPARTRRQVSSGWRHRRSRTRPRPAPVTPAAVGVGRARIPTPTCTGRTCGAGPPGGRKRNTHARPREREREREREGEIS